MGIENPAVVTTDTEGRVNDNPGIGEENEKTSGCFPDTPFSMDSEFDEDLGFPDSVTMLSVGDNTVLVERKENGDSGDEGDGPKEIPITSLYNQALKFNSVQRRCFIPGVEIHVKITDSERSITTHPLNPNL